MMNEMNENFTTPWWIKNNAPWEGEIFDNMILNEEFTHGTKSAKNKGKNDSLL